MGVVVPTDERGSKLRGRAPEPLFLVEWKDWPSPTSWTKEPYENFGDFTALADAFKAEWVAAGKPWPPTEASDGV